jgi:hypothetical protein
LELLVCQLSVAFTKGSRHRRITSSFGQVLPLLLAGIVFIVITIAVHSDKARSIILLISIVPAVACPISYYKQYLKRTSRYGSSRVTTGTVYTPKGSDYTSKHPEKTKEQIIGDFAGQTAEIWTEDSIDTSRLVLGLSYISAFGFMAFTVLTAFERAKRPKTS